MRKRAVSCQVCKKKETYPTTDMYVEFSGKKKLIPKYWHHECFEQVKLQREVEKEFKQQEAKELHELVNTIKSIHNLDNIPQQFFPFLQDLRNGTVRYKDYKKKAYKEGVKFSVIEKAYQLSKKKIQYAKKQKDFNNKEECLGELKYGLAIVQGRVPYAKREIQKQEQLKNNYVNPNHSYSEENVEPTKKLPKKY